MNCTLRNSTRSVRQIFAAQTAPGSPRKSFSSTYTGALGRGYQKLINDYDDQLVINQRLKKMLNYLKNGENSQHIKRQAIQSFENDIETLNKYILKRQETIFNVEKSIKMFKKTELQEYKRPKSPPVLAYRRPSPNLAPEINTEISDRSLKEKIHEDLVSLALYQEREIIVAKLKLKLQHDQRDLGKIREKFNDLDNWKDDNFDKIRQEKEKIHHLKELITLERSRIARIKHFTNERDLAAISIQSAWRGFMVRKGITLDKETITEPVNTSAPKSPRNRRQSNRK